MGLDLAELRIHQSRIWERVSEVAVVLVVIFTLVFLISSITDRIKSSIDSRSELSHTTSLQFLLVEFEHLDFFFEVLLFGSSTDLDTAI